MSFPLYFCLKCGWAVLRGQVSGAFALPLVGVTKDVPAEFPFTEIGSLLEFAVYYVPQLVRVNLFMMPQTEERDSMLICEEEEERREVLLVSEEQLAEW